MADKQTQKKIKNILLEVYSKGVDQEQCDLKAHTNTIISILLKTKKCTLCHQNFTPSASYPNSNICKNCSKELRYN
jgi:hypothetical protein